MTTRQFDFETEAEADAFIQGVQWVNDSAIDLVSKVHGIHQWIVTFTDKDGSDEEEEEAAVPTSEVQG